MGIQRPLHILAHPGDVAERVVVVGDPARAQLLTELLEDVKLVNTYRGLLTYTGRYRGVPVTVATHGIGAASAAIVFEELIHLGARVLVRLGTAGALREEISLGDVVVASGAHYYPGGTIGQYVPDGVVSAVADPVLTVRLWEELRRCGVRTHLGLVVSSDAFYAEDVHFVEKWVRRGALAVEMECAVLYVLSALRGVRAGAVLVISDHLRRGERVVKVSEVWRDLFLRVGDAVFKVLSEVEV